MRAAGSGAPISACVCCSKTDRSGTARGRARPPQHRAPPHRAVRRSAGRAEAIAALGVEDKGSVIVTASEGRHPGVVGLVAARLSEKFSRPAFAVALEPGGIGTGSGRSIAGVDLGHAVRQAVADGLLIKGGGHAMAAGVTLRKERLAEFRAFMEMRSPAMSRPRAISTNSDRRRGHRARGHTGAREIAGRAGPFGRQSGTGFRVPIASTDVRRRGRSGASAPPSQVGRRRIVNAMAFRAVGQKLGMHGGDRDQPIHVAGTLTTDRYQGASAYNCGYTNRGAGQGTGRDPIGVQKKPGSHRQGR